jgi:hypothetical protein
MAIAYITAGIPIPKDLPDVQKAAAGFSPEFVKQYSSNATIQAPAPKRYRFNSTTGKMEPQ